MENGQSQKLVVIEWAADQGCPLRFIKETLQKYFLDDTVTSVGLFGVSCLEYKKKKSSPGNAFLSLVEHCTLCKLKETTFCIGEKVDNKIVTLLMRGFIKTFDWVH